MSSAIRTAEEGRKTTSVGLLGQFCNESKWFLIWEVSPKLTKMPKKQTNKQGDRCKLWKIITQRVVCDEIFFVTPREGSSLRKQGHLGFLAKVSFVALSHAGMFRWQLPCKEVGLLWVQVWIFANPSWKASMRIVFSRSEYDQTN